MLRSFSGPLYSKAHAVFGPITHFLNLFIVENPIFSSLHPVHLLRSPCHYLSLLFQPPLRGLSDIAMILVNTS